MATAFTKITTKEVRGVRVSFWVDATGRWHALAGADVDKDPSKADWDDKAKVTGATLEAAIEAAKVKLRVKQKEIAVPFVVFQTDRYGNVSGRKPYRSGMIRGVYQGKTRGFRTEYLITSEGEKDKLSSTSTFIRTDSTQEERDRLVKALVDRTAAENEYDAALKAVKVDEHGLLRDIQKQLEAPDARDATPAAAAIVDVTATTAEPRDVTPSIDDEAEAVDVSDFKE